jgi:hypothetical protein
MADETIASIIALHQPKRAGIGAPRARLSRPRKRQKARRQKTKLQEAEAAALPDAESSSSDSLIPEEFLSPDSAAFAEPSVTPLPTDTSAAVTPSYRPVASILLIAAALALAAVGITTNGWFARSLGSSDIAGWLFLAIGVAADLVALVMPSCAAALWHNRQRATSLAGWAVWAMTFVFAVTAGIGFASVNITDVTAARAARVTPAVTAAQSALSDAMSARDRECVNGVGKFCR